LELVGSVANFNRPALRAAKMDFRLAVELRGMPIIGPRQRIYLLRFERSMIDARPNVDARQRLVLKARPKAAPFLQQLAAIPFTGLDWMEARPCRTS
jgi:hypothetical protein